jgi:hypothetical protein
MVTQKAVIFKTVTDGTSDRFSETEQWKSQPPTTVVGQVEIDRSVSVVYILNS